MIVDVAVSVPLPQTFHYRIPDELQSEMQVGCVVEVPFRRSTAVGVVLGMPETSDYPLEKLKPINSILSAPLFDGELLPFFKWLSDYYCHPLGEVLSAALPKQVLLSTVKHRKAEETAPVLPQVPLVLNPAQQEALTALLDASDKRPQLLHGVTGSGKTEVYLQTLSEYRKRGLGAIVLVPEISLTPQLMNRFSQRFPGEVAVWHSDLTPKERRTEWLRICSGEAKVVVGARSAIFAPLKNLGLIIVDEEHEPSYKQEDSFRYHARDVAILRGHFFKARVILGSATPSVESYLQAQRKKYGYLQLKDRANDAKMPSIQIVDLKDAREKWDADMGKKFSWLSQTLAREIRKNLEKKEQSLLFLNRLGFSQFLLCNDCGHTWRCKQCEVSLTYYKSSLTLKCGYCTSEFKSPNLCDVCHGPNLQGMGLGTEQVESSIQEMFPEARLIRLDRSVVKTRKQLEFTLGQIADKKVDIVIGTQMLAKGHDYPHITLVGVLLADSTLNFPDFRAEERTYQLLTQVSGRSGRGDRPGRVFLQTYNPAHRIFDILKGEDFGGFMNHEIQLRETYGFPPFSRLALVRLQDMAAPRVEGAARDVARWAERINEEHKLGCTLLGPSESPLIKLNGKYRWQILIKSQSASQLQTLIRSLQMRVLESKTRVAISWDIDPQQVL